MKKKVFSVLLSFLCAFVMVFSNVLVISADDKEFEDNYDYYCNLCSQRGLTDAQKTTCQNFRKYMQRQADALKSNINSINAQIDSLKKNITTQYNKIKEINGQIADVEKQIAGIQESIKVIETNIKAVEAEIAAREAKIEELNNNIKSYMELNQANISNNNYIRFVMGASSFVDLLRRVSAVNEITEYEVSQIHLMEEEKAQLELDKVELENQKNDLNEQRKSLDEYKSSLESLRKAAEELVAAYHAQSEALGASLAGVKQDMSELESAMADIDKVLDGFYPSDGWASPLKNSFYVSSAFPYYYPGDSSSGFHPATDLAVAYGSNLYAVGNGYVVKLRGGCPYGYIGDTCNGGYGNYVVYLVQVGSWIYIIINGHLSQINVSVGDVVRQSQTVVGKTGSSGNSSGPHLHIEMVKMSNTMTMKEAVTAYKNVGYVYYTLGRSVGYTCLYRSAPCFDNPLNILNIQYGRRYNSY